MYRSHHASHRIQQRAIPELAIDLLIRFGANERAGKGVSKFYFDKASRRKLEAYAGPAATALNQHLNLVLVIGDDGTVITAAHRTERIRRQ